MIREARNKHPPLLSLVGMEMLINFQSTMEDTNTSEIPLGTTNKRKFRQVHFCLSIFQMNFGIKLSNLFTKDVYDMC